MGTGDRTPQLRERLNQHIMPLDVDQTAHVTDHRGIGGNSQGPAQRVRLASLPETIDVDPVVDDLDLPPRHDLVLDQRGGHVVAQAEEPVGVEANQPSHRLRADPI